MYRFLIGRKTLVLLAGIWLVSGLLLLAAGWLLGRHESAPEVDRARLDSLVEQTAGTRRAAARSEPPPPPAPARRRAEPWKDVPSSAGSVTPESPAPPPPAPAASTPPPPPPATGPIDDSTSAATMPPPPPASAASTTPSPATPSPAVPAASSAMAGASQASSAGSLFSLQIGAFSSENNARLRVKEALEHGHDAYIVVVTDAERTLFTVRLGRYPSREQALEAAEELRRADGIAAVIRPVQPG